MDPYFLGITYLSDGIPSPPPFPGLVDPTDTGGMENGLGKLFHGGSRADVTGVFCTR